jgi:lipopolysaccharide export system protein LptA
MLRFRSALALLLASLTLPGCGGGKTTTVQITNKITSLPAGQTYVFTANVQHNHGAGVTLSLTPPEQAHLC